MLVDFFDQAAKSNPDQIAVEDRDRRRVTYGELDAVSSRIAHRLRRSGVQRGDRVGICLPKSIESVASILGVLKARAAYVPLDPTAPEERNRHILEDCTARMVCIHEHGAGLVADSGGAVSALVVPSRPPRPADASWLADTDPSWRASEPGADADLTYILYTSGSTGRPKGVMHTNASACSFVEWASRAVEPGPDDRFSSHAPFHFDLSIFDLYVCFRAGGTLVLVDEGLGARPLDLAAFISEREISIWYSVPSILTLLAQHGRLDAHRYEKLRAILFAGEVFPIKHLRLLQSFLPDKTYFNFYGPTETNVCTAYRVPGMVPSDQITPVPIGPPCDNVRALVLDDDRRPVPKGAEGLLYIHASGPTMSGYWPSRLEPRPDPFYEDPSGERWYCTGDVVREDAEGNYVYVGRRDRMVKRRGYRIELGEIEAALHRHEGIRDAAAVATNNGGQGVEIVVFVVANDPGTRLSIIGLKQFCMRTLPSYMCPDRFEFLTALPRTATDKVDLQHLTRLCPRKATAGE